MKFTLAQVKQSRIPKILNVCEDDPALLEYLNEASQRLLSRPNDWVGTWQQARFQIDEGCIVWPRGVLDIRQAKVCNTPMALRNEWYEYVGPVGQPNESTVTGNFMVLQANGVTPIPRNIQETGSQIRIYPGSTTDVNKRILFQGYDDNGVWVRTYDGTNDVWVDGEYVTLASPFATTVTRWTRQGITGIQRDITNQGNLVYEVHTDGSETQMADFQPDDEVPQYRASTIVNYRQFIARVAPGNCTFQIDCIVKLGHIPVRQDTDYFIIQNMAALKDAAMSVKLSEDLMNPTAGAQMMQSAVDLLNADLVNFTGRVTRIQANLHGGRTFGYKMRGMAGR